MNQSLALFKTVKSQYTGASLNKAAVESTAGWSFAEFYCKSRKYYFFFILVWMELNEVQNIVTETNNWSNFRVTYLEISRKEKAVHYVCFISLLSFSCLIMRWER